MLQIKRDDKKIIVEIKGKYPIHNWTYTLSLDLSSEAYAKLLHDNLSRGLTDRIRAIREKAYDQGFDDHKKRRPRASYHSGSIEI